MSRTAQASARRAGVPGVDAAAVRRWMAAHGIEPAGELSFERVGLGQSNLTYRLREGGGRSWVLRRPPLGELLESAHDVVREARILAALRETGVPVPEVHGVLPRGAVGDDAPAFLMSWVDGTVLDRMAVAEATPPALRRAVGLSLARTLAEVHAVDLDATGLSGLASHAPYAPRQLKRWSRQWEHSKTRELPALDALTRRLAGAAGRQRETTLVHGDPHPQNVITSPETGEVVAVLDWELSTLGEPLADLGTLLAYWPRAGDPAVQEFAPSTLDGFPTRDELVDEYARATGRDVSAVGFWHALGLWKIAVIAEGVLRRALDEPLNKAADGTLTPERVDALVGHAHEVATAAGI